METNPFTQHSDVSRAWPELFTDVDDYVTELVVQTAANTILENIPVDRDYVRELITDTQNLVARTSSEPARP